MDWNNTSTFSRCSAGGEAGGSFVACSIEIILFSTICLLITQEVLQLFTLGFRAYLREFENLIEMMVIILAVTCLWTQEHEAYIKWFSAFGIVLAYLGIL